MTTKQADTPTYASIYRKLAAVAGSIEAVDKDGKNKDQGYRYPTPASVMSAVKPLLNEHKLAIVPHLVEFTEVDTGQRSQGGKPFIINRVTMHYHILDGESGEELVVPWQAQAGTYGDDKGLAKAQTIALRTFLIQLFQIPAEDPETDPDARDARPSAGSYAAPQRAQARPPQRAEPPPTNGASYEPPSDEAVQHVVASKRKRMLERIAELTEQAVGLDLEIELSKPLNAMTEGELIEHGKNLSAEIGGATKKSAVPLADVPDPPQAKAA